MNSTNVESERYSDYFNSRRNIIYDAFLKKLKPDNMKEIIGAMMKEYLVEVRFEPGGAHV